MKLLKDILLIIAFAIFMALVLYGSWCGPRVVEIRPKGFLQCEIIHASD